MKVQAYDTFEYKCQTFAGFSMSKVVEELNKLGADGWELITIIKDDISRNRYILKRKIKSIET